MMMMHYFIRDKFDSAVSSMAKQPSEVGTKVYKYSTS